MSQSDLRKQSCLPGYPCKIMQEPECLRLSHPTSSPAKSSTSAAGDLAQRRFTNYFPCSFPPCLLMFSACIFTSFHYSRPRPGGSPLQYFSDDLLSPFLFFLREWANEKSLRFQYVPILVQIILVSGELPQVHHALYCFAAQLMAETS